MRAQTTYRIMKTTLGLFVCGMAVATLFVAALRVQAAFAAPEKAVVTLRYHKASIHGQWLDRQELKRAVRVLRAENRRLRGHVAGVRQLKWLVSDVRRTVCYVFGAECRHATTVSGCESGGQLDNAHGWLNAGNGQYLGGFQMGSSERATYANGHYSTVLDQVLAAYRLFMERGWRPWQCRETGGLRW